MPKQKYKEKHLAFEKNVKEWYIKKEKQHLVLQKYFVFEWVFAKTFIIMSLLKYIDIEVGGAGYIEI